MSQTSDPSRYIMDAENAAEMARLARQARVMTATVGLLPKELALSPGQAALDIGCGPGEWVLALAERFPGVEVAGIDISEIMTSYGRHLAREQLFDSVYFKLMDVKAPLAFPDASFDVIHARSIIGVMTPATWPGLLAECVRILKPGGYLIGIEGDTAGTSTSPSLNHLLLLLMQCLHKLGHCYTEAGEHFGVTVRYPLLLREAGLSEIHRDVFFLDYSSSTPAHAEMVQDWAILFHLVTPLFVQLLNVSETELAVLRARAIEEMNASNFCGGGFIQRAWGTKPAD